MILTFLMVSDQMSDVEDLELDENLDDLDEELPDELEEDLKNVKSRYVPNSDSGGDGEWAMVAWMSGPWLHVV